jgi:hypothetical protein
MTTEEILTKAARRKCRACYGKGAVAVLMEVQYSEEWCGFCYETGLWLPELTERCPCIDVHEDLMMLICGPCIRDWKHWVDDKRISNNPHSPECERCTDNRVLSLNDRDRLDAAAERLGVDSGLWWFMGENSYLASYTTADDMDIEGLGDTILHAQQAAFASVIKYIWPEVENEH